MAQLVHLDCKKVLIFSILLFFFVSVCFSACSQHLVQSKQGLSSRIGRRRLLEDQDDEWEDKPFKKKTTTQSQSQSKKNQTKLTKPTTTSSKNVKSDSISSTNKNQTKTIKSNSLSTKNNQTKTLKSSSNISAKNQTKTKTIKSENLSTKSSSSSKTTSTDTSGLKKLNSTSSASNKSNKKLNSTTTTSSTSKFKKLNSTSKSTLSNTPSTSKPTPPSTSSKKSLDLAKATNKTKKSTATKDKDKDKNKQTKTTTTNQASDSDQTKPIIKKPQKQSSPPPKKPTKQSPPTSYWMAEEDEDDFVSEFRDLPNKFHQTLLPDLERISTTSKLYLTKANSEITKGFKPYVGKKYASTVATAISCAIVLIPLLLVSLLCTQIKAYFSLQKIIIFTQVYLSIYFTILCVSSLVTGLEPLKFLYSTSQSTYLCLQVLQTLGYVFYLLMLLMYLVLVFSTECGLGSKFLGLAQTLVGIAVGLHYYVTVFHRVVSRQPPKTNWKVHGIYATCFLLICVLSRADRRKKLYVEEGGGEGKQN
ncbi:hypothetical protein PIB30_037163 [Stylosanthes scabra]|uniref:Uncharacterized protein n=1 Tax=Stylosanthes scabra TaxID=79078 RepID=A0ABU6UG93_9FABA|nr:hypothetical protein [Stylosanthes scabra]